MREYKQVFQTILDIRRSALEHLPVQDQASSRIRYDILIWLAVAWSNSKLPTNKQLYAEMPHSDSAIRHHFEELFSEGWVTLEGDNSDRRLRYVNISCQLETSFIDWGKDIKSIVSKTWSLE